MAMPHMRVQKFVMELAKGVRLEMIFQGIIGLRATLASIKQKVMDKIMEAIIHPTTNESDHGLMFPPKDVAITNAMTAKTMVVAPR